MVTAEEIGAIPVNFAEASAPEQIVSQTDGGVDRGIDAVGYQATVPEGEEQPAVVLNDLIETVRPTGSLGVVGLYLPKDPGGPTEEARNGKLLINIGRFFEKGTDVPALVPYGDRVVLVTAPQGKSAQVDAVDVEPDELTDAQSASVEELEDRAVADPDAGRIVGRRRVEDALHVVGGEHVGEVGAGPRRVDERGDDEHEDDEHGDDEEGTASVGTMEAASRRRWLLAIA